MVQSNYQEPIEKKDLDVEGKFRETKIDKSGDINPEAEVEAEAGKEKPEKTMAVSAPEKEIPAGTERETKTGERREEKISEKIETARRAISTQPAAAGASVATDAQTISQITEYEKKVEKLVELALQKGPEHAIKVARHMDKGKASGEMDNYTLDEVHDRMLEEELRKQLIQKGLLKEL